MLDSTMSSIGNCNKYGHGIRRLRRAIDSGGDGDTLWPLLCTVHTLSYETEHGDRAHE
jgi:hypothetical protein